MEWSADKAPMLGAALAYYTISSIAPLLVVTFSLAGFVFGLRESLSHVIRVFLQTGPPFALG